MNGGQFAFGKRDVKLIREAPVEACLRNFNGFLRRFHGVPGNRQAQLQPPQIDIVPGNIGDHGNEDGVAYFGKCLRVIANSFEFAAVLAEKVELPTGVETSDPG